MAADPDTRHLIVFRPMVEADLDAVVDNEMHAYGFPWTREVFRDCLRSNRHCWVACLGEDVVGHAVVAVGAAQSHLLNVCIRRRSQGGGLGRALVLRMLEVAWRAGARAVDLEVRPSNYIALRLYNSLGFTEVGVRKDYYPALAGHEDAQVLQLNLEEFFSRPR